MCACACACACVCLGVDGCVCRWVGGWVDSENNDQARKRDVIMCVCARAGVRVRESTSTEIERSGGRKV